MKPQDVGLTFPVNEIFETIQGEGHWTGLPSTFVRLQGCDVGCPWCDTKHTWSMSDPHFVLSKDELIDEVSQKRPRHVVITGGEPCIYDISELTESILDLGKTVQIETSGTYEIRVDSGVWVTVSPKIGMPGGLSVLPSSVIRADEIKMVIGKKSDLDALDELLQNCDAEVWLQPVSCSEKATNLCIEEATKRGFNVSIQVHKFIGVR